MKDNTTNNRGALAALRSRKAVWIPLLAAALCLLLAMPRLVNSYILRILIMIAI